MRVAPARAVIGLAARGGAYIGCRYLPWFANLDAAAVRPTNGQIHLLWLLQQWRHVPDRLRVEGLPGEKR
jgi:hypothetical protein